MTDLVTKHIHRSRELEDKVAELESKIEEYKEKQKYFQNVQFRKSELERYISILTSVPHENGTFVRELSTAVKEYHSLMFGDQPKGIT